MRETGRQVQSGRSCLPYLTYHPVRARYLRAARIWRSRARQAVAAAAVHVRSERCAVRAGHSAQAGRRAGRLAVSLWHAWPVGGGRIDDRTTAARTGPEQCVGAW